MRHALALLLALLLGSCATCPTPDTALGWWAADDRPVAVYVHPDVRELCRVAVDEAALFWIDLGADLQVPYVAAGDFGPAIYIVPEIPEGPAGLMRGSFASGVRQFARAEILIDPTWCADPHVAAHEIGHALGLPHSDDPRDLMWPTTAGGWRVPPDDVELVR